MEKFICELENLFQKKLSLYKTLKDVFEAERKCIVDMDVDSLWKITDRKKQLALEIEQVREEILFLLQEKKIPLDREQKGFNVFQSIKNLPFSVKIKSDLKKVKIQLDITKEELAVLTLENRRYINDYLAVIDGVFATITASENSESYTNAGLASTVNDKKHLIKEQV